jgi:uncharacterized delta-60 repeat protein
MGSFFPQFIGARAHPFPRKAMPDHLRPHFITCTVLFLLAACGPGLHIGNGGAEGLALILTSENLRKNDCVAATLTTTSFISASTSIHTAAVSLSASPSTTKLYSTLEGCQTFADADEVAMAYLSPQTPSTTFYVRAAEVGPLSLYASANAYGLTTANLQKEVVFESFDLAGGPSGPVNVVRLDSTTGKFYLGGNFQTFDDTQVGYVARLNADGTLDTSFAPVGTGLNGGVLDLAIQTDGKIVVTGEFTSYSGTARGAIARINTDGSLDTSFATGTGFNTASRALALQTDGKIVVVGTFNIYSGTPRQYIARLNTDGTLDGTFVPTGTSFNSFVNRVLIQPNGKIITAGNFTSFNSVSRRYIARLETDGSLDTGFVSAGTGFENIILGIALQGDGKVVATGFFSNYNSVPRAFAARVNADGSLDNSFDLTGTGLSGPGTNVVVQADGTILIAGGFTSYNGISKAGLLRLNADGSLDPSFTSGFDGIPSSMQLMASGEIVLVGSGTGAAVGRIARLQPDGSLAVGFATAQIGFVGVIYSTVAQDDAKILVGGSFGGFNGSVRANLARLNSDGSLDTSFALTGTGFSSYVQHLAILPNDKILVGGNFSTYNGVSVNGLARLNSDGSLDTGFAQVGTGVQAVLGGMAIQPDGKIIVGGTFNTYNGIPRLRIARLESNGSLDTSFTPGGGFSSTVNCLALQSDGKIVVGGSFGTFDSVSRPYIARLNPDGSLDTSFVLQGSGLNSSVEDLAIQPDGKIVLAGGFTFYNVTPVDSVVRLNSDGSLDTSFSPTGTGLSHYARIVKIQEDGKILVGGGFTSYDGTAQPFVTRLMADGTLDPGFAPSGTGINGGVRPLLARDVHALEVQADHKILVGGEFENYGTETISPLTRLTYSGALD